MRWLERATPTVDVLPLLCAGQGQSGPGMYAQFALEVRMYQVPIYRGALRYRGENCLLRRGPLFTAVTRDLVRFIAVPALYTTF